MSRDSLTTAAALAASALVLAACSSPPPEEDPEPPAQDPSPTQTVEPDPETTESEEPDETDEPDQLLAEYGFNAGHPLATAAGEQILADGGSAGDAIVAGAFAVAVVEPFASGIGGGGSAIVVPAQDEAIAYDFREEVPANGVIPAGGVGIPGFVAGMATIHDEHGVLEWADVLAPAISLAEDGFEVSPFLALRLQSDYGPEATAGLDHFNPGGSPLDVGAELVQADLAQTMRTIAEDGPRSYYEGTLTAQLASVAGIDEGSLADYEVVTAEPVRGEVGDYELLAAPPALPGVALIQMLQVAEAGGLADAEPGTAPYMELLGQGWSVGHETTDTVLGDPAFVDVPLDELTNPQTNATLTSATFSAPATTNPPGPAAAGNTTHLTAVDTDGLMISMTNTITNFWGSQRYVGGYFLNNQLTRFDAIGSTSANNPEAGKRSVSWSLPAVVADSDGRAVLGLGTPGADRIPQVMAQVISRWGLHGQSLEDAVLAPRFAYEPDRVAVEEDLSADVASGLSTGYEVIPVEWAYFGSVQALQVDYDTGNVTGVADPRREAEVAVGTP